jgi:hypothetical protein
MYRLLLTWRSVDRRGRLPADFEHPDLIENWSRREELYVEIERAHGDGHYDDRKQRLDRWLEGHEEIDLRPVLEALYRVRDERRPALLQGKGIDFARRLRRHQQRRRQLITWAEKLKSLLLDMRTDDPMTLVLLDRDDVIDALDDLVELEQTPNSIIKAIDALLERLSSDPLRHLSLKSPVRRHRRGAPSGPWIARLRRELLRAGVEEDSVTELMILVGLHRYRPHSSSNS